MPSRDADDRVEIGTNLEELLEHLMEHFGLVGPAYSGAVRGRRREADATIRDTWVGGHGAACLEISSIKIFGFRGSKHLFEDGLMITSRIMDH